MSYKKFMIEYIKKNGVLDTGIVLCSTVIIGLLMDLMLSFGRINAVTVNYTNVSIEELNREYDERNKKYISIFFFLTLGGILKLAEVYYDVTRKNKICI